MQLRRKFGLTLAATCGILFAKSTGVFAQADPASEPAVLALAKVLPAVVNINTERVVRRAVRDPFEEFYSQFFGYDQARPHEIRQTLQSLGSGFIIDPTGYIVTNQHVVERAADLKIHVTTNDGKTYSAHYITGDDKTDLAFIKIDAKADFPFVSLDNISQNLLGETVIVVGNAVGYGSSISRGVLSAVKRNITVDNIEYKDLVQTDEAGVERGLVIYRVGQEDVNSVKQIENLLGRMQSGTSVNFVIGVIHVAGQVRQVATLTIAAR